MKHDLVCLGWSKTRNATPAKVWGADLRALMTAPFSGTKAVITLGDNPSAHSILRELFYETMFSRAVAMAPLVETCLTKRAKKWDQMAKSGEVS